MPCCNWRLEPNLPNAIHILGGGPSGAAAAIAALQQGAKVRLIEKSRFPRHKVCGEFLSPEIAPALERLQVWDEFAASRPGTIRRLALHFPKTEKRCRLPEAAFGMSRYRFDQILWEAALRAGAEAVRDVALPEGGPRIVACGRKTALPRGSRLFGFKAHFAGPLDDAVELFFFSGCYVGVNPADNGITNVCGIAPENFLREHRFDMDAVVHSSPHLRERLAPLNRTMEWLSVGPLAFRNGFKDGGTDYLAGDALSFVDPFTGSGLLAAVVTGRLAGIAAARGTAAERHLRDCGKILERPFAISTMFRLVVARGWGDVLAPLIPGGLLFGLTRPRAMG